MTAMIPALAVTALLHDRPTAITMFPTRGGSSVTAAAARSNPLTSKDGQTGRGIPAGQFGLLFHAVVAPHPHAIAPAERRSHRHDHVVAMDEAADRPSTSPDLDDGGRDGSNGIGNLSGQGGQHGGSS